MNWLDLILDGTVILALVIALLILAHVARSILLDLVRIQATLDALYARLFPEVPTGLLIQQLEGAIPMPITGIVTGQTGTFKETPLPAGAAVPAGSTLTWTTSDNANTALTPSADGTTVAVVVAAGATITTFNLTLTATGPAFTSPVASTVAVPVLQPTPPLPTGFQIDQTS